MVAQVSGLCSNCDALLSLGQDALASSSHAKIGRIVAHGIGMVSHEQPMINRPEQGGRTLAAGHILSLETEFLHPEVGHVVTHRADLSRLEPELLGQGQDRPTLVRRPLDHGADADLARLYGERSNYDLPSLHIIGRSDAVVPREASLSLAAKFKDPLILEHESGHVISNAPADRPTVPSFS